MSDEAKEVATTGAQDEVRCMLGEKQAIAVLKKNAYNQVYYAK